MAEFKVTIDVKKLLKRQGEKIRQLTAERDAARDQVDKDGARIERLERARDSYKAAYEAQARTNDGYEAAHEGYRHELEVQVVLINAQVDRIDQQAAEIAELVAEVGEWHKLATERGDRVQELESQVERGTKLVSRLNKDLDEVCRELAHVREELHDHHRFGSDKG